MTPHEQAKRHKLATEIIEAALIALFMLLEAGKIFTSYLIR